MGLRTERVEDVEFNFKNRLEMVSPTKQYPIASDKKVEYTYDYKGRRIFARSLDLLQRCVVSNSH